MGAAGQTTKARSAPVALASDQAGLPLFVPATADILVGNAITDGGTVVTIPANRTAYLVVTLSGSLSTVSTGTAPSVQIAGSTATPAAGTKLLSLPLALGATAGGVSGTVSIPVVVVAGSSAATITVTKNSATAISASASGWLIA